jgi:hypothetical protein
MQPRFPSSPALDPQQEDATQPQGLRQMSCAEIRANAKLRTDPGKPAVSTGNIRPNDYLKELSRLVVTHS